MLYAVKLIKMFKVGDKVICINDKQKHADCPVGGLKKDKIYSHSPALKKGSGSPLDETVTACLHSAFRRETSPAPGGRVEELCFPEI